MTVATGNFTVADVADSGTSEIPQADGEGNIIAQAQALDGEVTAPGGGDIVVHRPPLDAERERPEMTRDDPGYGARDPG